jgi:hypothetical protein
MSGGGPRLARCLSVSPFDMVDLQRSHAAVQVPKPPKRASQRSAEVRARVIQIQSGLAGQEKRQADYKKTLPAKSSNRGLLYLCVFISKRWWAPKAGAAHFSPPVHSTPFLFCPSRCPAESRKIAGSSESVCAAICYPAADCT